MSVEDTKVADKSWRRFAFRVKDYITPTATTQLRFIASDSIRPGQYLDGGSLIEAAFDDLQLWDASLVDLGNDTTVCGGETVVLDAGNPGATYLWSTGATTQTITVASSGTIWVTVNSSASDTVTVTVFPLLILNTSFNSTSCVLCDGNATVTPSGGTPPYVYFWNPGAQADSIATNLCANTYSVLVTDANGCTETSSVTITAPGGLTSGITSSADASCIGVCDGDATVTATGGSTPYTYSWDTGDTLQSQTGLCAGTYTASVIDSNGCITSVTVEISAPQIINLVTVGNNNGTATVTATGGTEPYTYLWNDPMAQTTATATGLTQGNYIVQVTDAAGCVNSKAVTVPQPSGIDHPESNNQIRVYPNPGSGVFSVEIYDLRSTIFDLRIYDVLGRDVYKSQVPSPKFQDPSGEFQIDLSGQPGGVYFLTISNSTGIRTEKLIVY